MFLTFARRDGETDKELFERILLHKTQIGTWAETAEVVNLMLGTSKTAEVCRKHYANHLKHTKDTDPVRLLRMERQAFRDERTGWEKQNRAAARLTVDLDFLADIMTEVGAVQFPSKAKPEERHGDFDLLVVLSDWHIGAAFRSVFGEYSTDIAVDRLGQLLQHIEALRETYNIDNLYVMAVGDMISGNIHRSVQVKNRENICQQIKASAELQASFISKLCDKFVSVRYTACSGNHSRIDTKENAIRDERLDDVVSWAVSLLLNHKVNFEFVEPPDTSIARLVIHGQEWLGVHGDYDKTTAAGIQRLAAATRSLPYAVVCGHMHTPLTAEYNGIHLVQGGSLCGSGDDFTVQKRLTGRPSQTVILLKDGKIEGVFPYELD